MKKSRYVGVIDRKEVGGNNPIEYFLPHGGQKYLLSPRGSDGS